MSNFYVDVNIYMEAATALFDLILVIYLAVAKQEGEKGKRFFHFALAVLWTDFIDVFSVAALRDMDVLPETFVLVLNELGYFCAATVAYTFSNYVDACLNQQKKDAFYHLLNKVLMVLIGAQLFINTFTRRSFYPDPELRAMNYSPYFYMVTGVSIAVMLLHVGVRVLTYKEALTKKQLRVFAVLYLLAIIGIILEQRYETTLPIAVMLISIGMYGMFFSIQSPDYRSMVEVIEELNRAEKEADEASQTKGNFLANMSHEIRTPLNAILGMNDLILQQSGEMDVIAYGEAMKKSGQDLLKVVNDILDYSKLQDGDFEPVYSPFSLSALIDELMEEYMPKAREKDLSFTTNMELSLPDRLYGDSAALKRILSCLTDNAVKYTTDGYVVLSVRPSTVEQRRELQLDSGFQLYQEHFFDSLEGSKMEERIRRMKQVFFTMEIADTGKGMAEGDIPMMFDSFQRIAVQGVGAISGSGLGLSISRSLVNALGGKIDVESKVGYGSTFRVTFALYAMGNATVEEVSKNREQQKVEEEEQQQIAPVDDNLSVQIQDRRILVVDDDPMNRKIASAIIFPYVYACDLAESGQEALKMMGQNTYDMVLLDYHMPGMNGPETLIRAKVQGFGYTPRYILVTSVTADEARRFAKENGFDGFIEKPISRNDVEKLLKS